MSQRNEFVAVAQKEVGTIEGPKDNETKYGAFTKADGTIKLLQKQGRFDEANKLKEKYPYDLAVLKNIDAEIKKIDKAIISITNAKFEQLEINREDFNKLSKRQQDDVLLTVRQSKYQEIQAYFGELPRGFHDPLHHQSRLSVYAVRPRALSYYNE